MNKLYRYIKDFGLVFLSSILVTVVTSFIINPILASELDTNVYGSVLTLCGYVAIISSAIGNSLNNVRLLDKNSVTDNKKNYNAILILFSLIGTAFMAVLSGVYINSSVCITIGLCLYVFLSSLNLYWIVSFRLHLNYMRNLFYNVCVCVGYIVGLIFFKYIGFWPIIYVCGQFFGLIFLLINTKLPYEGIRIDRNFGEVLKAFLYLFGTTFISQALSLLDRVVLHPLVGEVAVSQYNTAAFFGKGIGTLFAPIALVLLSYFVKDGFVITKKMFGQISGLGIASVLVIVLLSIPVAPYVTKLLYPTIYEQAEGYIFIANIGAMLSALGVLLNPMVLKVCSIKWQPIIQLLHGGMYFVLGVVGAILWGINGFAYACIIANLGKVVLLLILGGKFETT